MEVAYLYYYWKKMTLMMSVMRRKKWMYCQRMMWMKQMRICFCCACVSFFLFLKARQGNSDKLASNWGLQKWLLEFKYNKPLFWGVGCFLPTRKCAMLCFHQQTRWHREWHRQTSQRHITAPTSALQPFFWACTQRPTLFILPVIHI